MNEAELTKKEKTNEIKHAICIALACYMLFIGVAFVPLVKVFLT